VARPTQDDIRIARAHRRAQRRGKSRVSIAALRVAELNRLFHHRYGNTLPDDDDGRDNLQIIAHHMSRHPDGARRIREYANAVAPWLPDDEFDQMLANVAERPIRWRAATLGKWLHLTDADRRELRIRTIGCVDKSKADRIMEQRERRRAAQEQRRRAAGARPRAQYHAERRAKFNPCPI
jgi:hypothetical protein